MLVLAQIHAERDGIDTNFAASGGWHLHSGGGDAGDGAVAAAAEPTRCDGGGGCC